MEKEKIIFGVVILFVIVGALIYVNSTQFHVSVGDTSFKVPNGYSIADDKMIGITNGSMSIFFNDTNKTNLNKTVSEYVDLKEKHNFTVNITHLKINGYDVYKSNVVNSTGTFHYWFIKNGKVYEICTWNGNENTDKILYDIL